MDLFSLMYFGMVALLMVVYYGLPRLVPAARRYQWVVLLIASLLFYVYSSTWHVVFIVGAALVIWLCGNKISAIEAAHKLAKKDKSLTREDKKALKEKALQQKRVWLWAGILATFGFLAWVKYWSVLFPSEGFLSGSFLLPLGISFYTFQATSYLIDLHGGKYAPEKNFWKFLLFVSWFPQLLQGPIGRYDKLSSQLSGEHRFEEQRTKRALLLLLFGLLKKYAIADMLVTHIANIFDGPLNDTPGSVIVLGILFYSAQQYADFSGGIEIVSGVYAMYCVNLAQTFSQPYFSVSLGDFWRRWHISLGAWMRDYIFYPFALLKPMQSFSKWCSKHMNKHFGRVLPAGIANILVFLIVGIWHGASLHYVFWGLYNGVVIALSDLTAPLWEGVNTKLHLKSESFGFRVFRIIRTFIIVNIGWYFDRIEDFGKCLLAFRRTVLNFDASIFGMAFSNELIVPSSAFNVWGSLAIAFVGCIVVLCVSLLRERGFDIYERLYARPAIIRFACFYAMIFLILASFVFTTSAGGFLYANF